MKKEEKMYVGFSDEETTSNFCLIKTVYESNSLIFTFGLPLLWEIKREFRFDRWFHVLSYYSLYLEIFFIVFPLLSTREIFEEI